MSMEGSSGLAAIQQRLDQPGTGDAVVRLLDRLDTIEGALDTLENISNTLPGVISIATDTFDRAAARSEEAGTNVDDRLQQGLKLAERLTQPDTLRILTGLVDRIDKLEPVLELMDKAPAYVSIAVDSVDDFARLGLERGIDINARIRSTYELGEKLTSPETVDALSNVLDPGAVSIVGMIGQTLVRCREECLSRPKPPQASVWDLFKLTRTEDGKRALAFLCNFGRLWGQGINQMHAAHRAQLEANSETDHE